MKTIEILTQVLELIAALTAAPLFVGGSTNAARGCKTAVRRVSGSLTAAFANSFTRTR